MERIIVKMKKKIVLLPLDERPCNYEFPFKLFNNDTMEIIRPKNLGNKKQSANVEDLICFLEKECKDANGLILSIDTLLYGGLIPSRLHNLSEEIVEKRFDIIRKLKNNNPQLIIYAFQCIMRCPQYSSSDEEPDYYELCGTEISKIGDIRHRYHLGICDDSRLTELYDKVEPQYLEDYLNRRKFNLRFNLMTLDLVKKKVVDFLIVPQDDSAKYGFTAMDQEIIREKITKEVLQDSVMMYPGADEIGLTLMSRFLIKLSNRKPRVYVKYASEQAPLVIPAYEDRTLGETIKYHIMAAGCSRTTSLEEADIVLAINCPSGEMKEAIQQPVRTQEYCVERTLIEFVFFIEECIQEHKLVTIGDNAYANGGDLELISILNKRNLLDKLNGYAGWNTSSNTLGTALAQGIYCFYNGSNYQYKNFLMLRYMEDVAYCSYVRKHIVENYLPELGMDYFNVVEQEGIVSKLVKEQLCVFKKQHLSSIEDKIKVKSVRMPWKRMFEAGLDIEYGG